MNIQKILSHLAIAAGIVLVLIYGSMFLLKLGTLHGKELEVPDFANLTVTQAEILAKENHVRIDVVDSVYVRKMPKGIVYKQNPLPGSKVKKGRRILITINSVNGKKVMVPNLVGVSMRQATSELQSRGLALGRLLYRSDMATDNVLGQQRGGMPIEPGTKVESGTAIDLVVGLNSSDFTSRVPKLNGMGYMTAVDAVHSSSLNVGSIVCDSTVVTYNDSLRAVVYMQKPSPQSRLRKGSTVSFYLTLTPEKYEKPKPEKKAATSTKSKSKSKSKSKKK